MKHRYQITFRVHDGWEFNDPKRYSERVAIIEAVNRQEAFAEAQRIAAEDDKYEVTVRKKDVVRIHGDEASIADRMPGQPELSQQKKAK